MASSPFASDWTPPFVPEPSVPPQAAELAPPFVPTVEAESSSAAGAAGEVPVPDWLRALDDEAPAESTLRVEPAPELPELSWWETSAAPAAVEASPVTPAVEPEPEVEREAMSGAPVGLAPAVAASPEHGPDTPAAGTSPEALPAAPAAAPSGIAWDGAALYAVAEHLERLAARARQLAEAPAMAAVESDPLDLFLLGYALGWRRGQRGS